MPLHEQTGLATHHILHVALRHSARLADLRTRLGAKFDTPLYNLAADAMINEFLLLASHALPRPAVTLTGLLTACLDQNVSPEVALSGRDVDKLYFALAQSDKGTGGRKSSAQAYAERASFDPNIDPSAGGAHSEGEVEQAARWHQHMARGGGTAFVPVVQEAQNLRASALVILTDLEADPGPAPRGLLVIWAVSDRGAASVPYGRLIDLSH